MRYILLLLLSLFLFSCKTTFTATNHLLNKGFPNNNVSNLNHRLKRAVLKYHPSLVIIMIGTNDMINPHKMLSFASYKNKLRNLVKNLKQHYIDVLLLSPPPIDTTDLFFRRSRKRFKILPNEKIDSAISIIHQIALEQHCMYLDINSIFKSYHSPNATKSSLIRNELNSGRIDGVHPTAAGYQLIAKSIYTFLKDKDKNYQKIICFGDSITFGAYVRGEGTTRGETYPAVLKRLLFGDENKF